MALINCLECGQKISDKAINCPKCGWKVGTDSSVDFYGNSIESKETVNSPVKKGNISQKKKSSNYTNRSTKTYESLNQGLIKAYKLRQNDNGWGYAVAHVIPLVWIYYAISRKTITPFIYCFILSFICGLVFGEAWAISYLFSPFATKAAIGSARAFAKKKLKEHDISDIESSPDFSQNKFCRDCGVAMNMNDIFCRSCGQKN